MKTVMNDQDTSDIVIIYHSRIHVIIVVLICYIAIGPLIGNISLFTATGIFSLYHNGPSLGNIGTFISGFGIVLIFGLFPAYLLGACSALAVGSLAAVHQAGGRRIPRAVLVIGATVVGLFWLKLAPSSLGAFVAVFIHVIPALVCRRLTRNVVWRRPEAVAP